MPTRPPKGYWDIDNSTDPANVEAVLYHLQHHTDTPIDAVNVLRRALAEWQQRAERGSHSAATQGSDKPVQSVEMPVLDGYTRAVPHKVESFVCAECGDVIELLHYPGAFLPSVCDKPGCQEAAEQHRKQANAERQRRYRERHKKVTDAEQASVTNSVTPDADKRPAVPKAAADTLHDDYLRWLADNDLVEGATLREALDLPSYVWSTALKFKFLPGQQMPDKRGNYRLIGYPTAFRLTDEQRTRLYDLTLLTARQAALDLAITPAQFNALRKKAGIEPDGWTTSSQHPGKVYLYRFSDVERLRTDPNMLKARQAAEQPYQATEAPSVTNG